MTLALLYGLGYAPDWPGPHAIVDEVVVRFRSIGVTGIYLALLGALFSSWFALPRYTWATRMLFWSFIVLGLSVILTVWQTPFWVSGFGKVRATSEQLCFAMPSFFAALFVASASKSSSAPQTI